MAAKERGRNDDFFLEKTKADKTANTKQKWLTIKFKAMRSKLREANLNNRQTS